MGMHLWAKSDLNADLRWTDAGAIVIRLAYQFDNHAQRDPLRDDMDDISPEATARLEADAPTDLEAFRAYCLARPDCEFAAELDTDGLKQIRTFISDCARLGGGITVSY